MNSIASQAEALCHVYFGSKRALEFRMKFTGLEVFDSTIQRTNSWLKELMQELNTADHRKTYLILRSVLHAFRDHLSGPDAIYVGEQLPMLIRGLYFEHWDPAGKPLPLRNRDDFFAVLAQYMARDGDSALKAETAARAVFRLLERKAAEGEIEDLHSVIPLALMDLWPPALRAA
jgi:uncharacterized protein (DUF2267 family)